MVALMLNYTRKESAYLLFMRLKVLILPTQEYMLHPLDVLGKARQAQAAFPAAHRIATEHFYFRIYKHKLTSGTLRESLFHRICIDDHYPVIAPNLRGGQPYTFRFVHGCPHPFKKSVQSGIIRLNLLGYVTQHRMAIKIYR